MSMIKIDMDSEEFKKEMEKTIKFTDKVCQSRGWVYNPLAEVNEGVQMGLARNKIMYKKRFCPCFMVEEVDGKAKSVDDRLCPCGPAIEKELEEDGRCHCQLFCTPEYAKEKRLELGIEDVVHTHSRGLTQEECKLLINKVELDSQELDSLLEARKLNMVDFKLVDVREHMEWKMSRITGTDELVPTSSFFSTLEEVNINKDANIIIYCHIGSRSAHCMGVLKDLGFSKISNLTHGISAYSGKKERS